MNFDVATMIVALFGGGGVAAVVTAVTSWRKGIRDADVAKEQTAIAGFQELAERLSKEVEGLRTRLDRVEHEIDVERGIRWAAVQYARTLVHLIAQHLPGTDIPAPPDSLADHIVIPERKDPS